MEHNMYEPIFTIQFWANDELGDAFASMHNNADKDCVLHLEDRESTEELLEMIIEYLDKKDNMVAKIKL